MDWEITFGPVVKERRNVIGLTQAELARRVGCAAITIRKIEADALRPSVQIAEHLAVALNVSEEEQLAFVRLARADHGPSPLPTPEPLPEEIGQEDLSGRAIRGFELHDRVGAGSYGAVYRAVQTTVEREVAIKIILPKFADRPEFIRRFEAEAHLVARLEHPHIVPLYDYWREPGVAYLVMRLLRGGSLETQLNNGPLASETILPIMEQICTGLYVAHQAGVIHRDIKPANILLDHDGNSYLADFGIAKNLSNTSPASMTMEGTVIGSPAYISPEQILAEPVKPQTDVYSVGVMLYELLTGRRPFKGPTPFILIQQHLNEPLPLLSQQNGGAATPAAEPAVPTGLDIVIARATAKDPLDRYPDILSLLADFRRAMTPGGTAATLAAAQTPVAESPHIAAMLELPDLENPYKGLRAFTEADAPHFFGRETLIQDLLARMAETNDLARFLAVIGPSGSGKSSVVRAGLIPALRQGGLPGSENWFITEMLPGAHPFEELEAALLRVAVNPPESLLSQLYKNERGLLRAVRRILPADGDTELVLVLDQFEEVFTLVQNEATRAHFLDSLVTAILDPRSRLWIVITLRADFTDQPLQYVDFGELVRQRTEFVLPLTPDELEQAIVGPTERAGLSLEQELTPTIIREIGNQPGTLPLLQYALTELFERREGRLLTRAAYQASGGVLGAIARRTEDLYAGLDEAGQKVARQLFLRLVTLGEGAEDTRRRVLRSELASLTADGQPPTADTSNDKQSAVSRQRSAVIGQVINLFGRHRLLTFDRDPVTRGPTVEVAHEALIREWKRLKNWLNEDREFLLWQQRLRTIMFQWEQNNRDEGALLRGASLVEAEKWTNQRQPDLSEAERTFIRTGLELRERKVAEREAQRQRELEAAQKLAEAESRRAEEQVQAAGQLRKRAWYLTGALFVAGLLAVVAVIFGQQAGQNEQKALTQEAIAVAEANDRATAQANALAEAEQRATAQANAETQQQEAERQAEIAFSRELAAAALNNLDVDQERSVLLALHATKLTKTKEAEEALHRTLANFRLHRTLGEAYSIYNPSYLAYSPDGRYLVIGTKNGTLIIWDTELDEERFAWSGHSELVNQIGFYPDGSLMATTSDDTTAKIWNFRQLLQTDGGTLPDSSELEPMVTIQSDDWVVDPSFSPDGTKLAIASGRGTVQIWDVLAGRNILTFPGHPEQLWGITFSPDGKRLITHSGLDPANIWDAETGDWLGLLDPNDTVAEVVFSPDGGQVATGSIGGTVQLWDNETGELILTLSGHASVINGMAFTADGLRLATGGADGILKLWDLSSGQELLSLVGETGTVNSMAISPACVGPPGSPFDWCGPYLASSHPDGTIRIWDISPAGSREVLIVPGVDGWFNLDGSEFIAVNPLEDLHEDKAQIWRVPNLNNGDYDPAGVRELRAYPLPFYDLVHDGVVGTISQNRDLMAVFRQNHDIVVFDHSSGEILHSFSVSSHPQKINALAFHPDGTQLATAGKEGTAKVWDISTGQERFTLEGHIDELQSVQFSHNGSRLITASYDGTAKIWDTTSGAELLTLQGHTTWIWEATFSLDGKFVATGSRDATARIWDALTGEELLTLTGHTGTVTGVAFNPDGGLLATSSFDGTARVWDIATGNELLKWENSGPGVVHFSPDGTLLAASNVFNQTVQVYVLNIKTLQALAQQRVTRTLTPEECRQFLHLGECPAEP